MRPPETYVDRPGVLLITGASGYLGRCLVPHFANIGAPYLYLGTWFRQPVEQHYWMAPIQMDLGDPAAVDEALSHIQPTHVVHAAAATNANWCEENPGEARRAILGGTANLVESLNRHAAAARLVMISTDLVFDGEAAPYDEGSPAKPAGVYGSLKNAAEQVVLGFSGGVVLRSSLIYGPPAGPRGTFLGWMHGRLSAGQALTLFEDEWRTPVFIDDLCEAIRILLAGDSAAVDGGIFHAGGGESMTRVEIGQAFAHGFDLDPRLIAPSRRGDVPSAAPRPRDVSLTCARLLALGWRQTPFTNGIQQCRSRWAS